MNQKVTINVVAEFAEVSKKTVSRVLNNESNVSDKTRKKVLDAFAELGYSPSVQARALASNQSFLIGLIYDNPNKSYVADIQAGALKICQENGYHLIIQPTDHENSQVIDALEKLIISSRLDGLVLTPPFSDNLALIKMIESKAIPFARIAPTVSRDKDIAIVCDDFNGAKAMTQHLIELGHRRIGFIKGHPQHPASELRLQGYLSALKANDIEAPLDCISQGYFSFKSGEASARQLLQLAEPPTAIFASNDFMAAAVLKVANQLGIKVPDELSVSGFDDSPISSYLWPALTTVQQPIEKMAAAATSMLLRSIKVKNTKSMIKYFTNNLIVRDSTAKLKQTKL